MIPMTDADLACRSDTYHFSFFLPLGGIEHNPLFQQADEDAECPRGGGAHRAGAEPLYVFLKYSTELRT